MLFLEDFCVQRPIDVICVKTHPLHFHLSDFGELFEIDPLVLCVRDAMEYVFEESHG